MKCLDPSLGEHIFNADLLDDSGLRKRVSLHRQECQYCKAQWNNFLVLIKEIDANRDYHPTADQIYTYASVHSEQKLDEKDSEQIAIHLQDCSECREVIERVKANDGILTTFFAGEELSDDLTKEQEELFAEQMMSKIRGTSHDGLVETQSNRADTKSWYENLLGLLLKPRVVFRVAVGLGLLAIFVLGVFLFFNQRTEKTIIGTNSKDVINTSPSLPVGGNLSNQNSNNNQLIVPTSNEERAKTNQQKKTPQIAEDTKNTTDKRRDNLKNDQPNEQTQVQEIAALSESQRSSNQRVLIQIEQPLLRIPINLSQWSESHLFTATLLEESINEVVWSSKSIKPINQKDAKVIRLTIPTNLLTSGNYTLRVKGFQKNAADAEESFTYYILITRKSDK